METSTIKQNESAFSEVRSYDNDKLKVLLKEISKIGNSDTPALIRKSKAMTKLFNLEKEDFRVWIDLYHNVKMAIESEILHRIKTDRL